MTLQVIIALILLFTLFRVLNIVLHKFVMIPLKLKYHLGYVLPAVELVAWVTLLLMIARFTYQTESYFAFALLIVLLALLAVPLFFVVRNFIAGVVLRLQYRLTEGMNIETEGVSGVVKKVGYLGLEIEDTSLDIYSIPYHALQSKTLIRQGNNPFLKKGTLRFELPLETDLSTLCMRLKKEVLNTPWAAISQPPVVEKAIEKNGKAIIHIGVFMPDKSYAGRIQHTVLSAFSTDPGTATLSSDIQTV